jgi:hypothetical protein
LRFHDRSTQQIPPAGGDRLQQRADAVLAKNNAVEELDSVAQARDAKTLRLREARLAKELADRMSATSNLIAKRAKSC